MAVCEWKVGLEEMVNRDPTVPALWCVFALAIGVAVAAILARAFLGSRRVVSASGVGTDTYRVWDMGVVFLLFQFFGGLVVLMLMMGGSGSKDLRAGDLLGGIVMQVVVAWVVMAVVTFRLGPVEWLGMRWAGWRSMLWIGPGCVLLMWAVFGVMHYGGYVEWMESMGVEPVQNTVKLLRESDDVWLLFLMGFAALVVAPLCEEIVFRGYCYPVLKKYAGGSAAMVSTSLVFACAHGNLTSALPLFLLGVLLVVVYERTRSIWAPVGVHFCFNGATVVVQMLARWLEIPIDGDS